LLSRLQHSNDQLHSCTNLLTKHQLSSTVGAELAAFYCSALISKTQAKYLDLG
jgi:hypothetical protein